MTPFEANVEAARLAKNAAYRAWYARNPEKIKALTKARDSTKAVKSTQAWNAKNQEKRAAYLKQYFVTRKQTDPLFKLRCSLSKHVASRFRYGSWGKTTKTQELLGCTFEEFAVHLQKQFKEGMTLENHGDWHIDHIKPCATATSAEELAALFHFTNLQPLWASENLSKGCKYHGNEQRT